MTISALIAGIIGFLIGIGILDMWCLFIFRENVFKRIKRAWNQRGEDLDPLDPSFYNTPSAEQLRPLAFPYITAVDDPGVGDKVGVLDIPSSASVLFGLEGNERGCKRGIACRLQQHLLTNEPTVLLVGASNDGGEMKLDCYDYKGDLVTTVAGSLVVVPNPAEKKQ